MHLDGTAIRTCMLPISAVAGQAITTIEGLSAEGNLHPLQAAWQAYAVPQCGYCQSGQIMSAAALLESNPNPSEADVEIALAGNICRCGCYPRIKKAVLAASESCGLFKNAMTSEEVIS